MRHRDSGENDAPLVGRPRGAAWRALQADGVLWEGQALLVGTEVDLAARLILTRHRLAFARGGEVALDVPRAWLRPVPVLRRDGALLVSIAEERGTQPETLVLRLRDEQPALAKLLALLGAASAEALPWSTNRFGADALAPGPFAEEPFGAGRPPFDRPQVDRPPSHRFRPNRPADAPASSDRPAPEGFATDPFPSDRSPTGARPTRVLPPLPEPARPDVLLPGRRPWDEPEPSPDAVDGQFALAAAAPPREPLLDPMVRPAAPPVAIGRDRDWNLEPIREMVPRGNRRRRRGWTIRLGGLVLLLAVVGFIGMGGMPSRPSQRTPTVAPPAGNAAGRTTVAQRLAPTVPPTTDPTAEARRTAEAIGVGGPDPTATAAPPEPADPTRPADPSTANPTESAGLAQAADPTDSAAPEPPTATTEAAPTATSEPESTTAPPTATADTPAVAPEPTLAVDPPTAPPAPATTDPAATELPPTEPAATVAAEPTPTETVAPTAAPTPEPVAGPTQGPSLAVNEVPDQGLVAGPLRLAVEVAQRGRSLPDLALASAAEGEWVALVVHVRNWSDAAAELAMADLRLGSDDASSEVGLDGVTGVVGGLLGFDPAFGVDDVVAFEPGQTRRLALVFLAPEGTATPSLRVGEMRLALDTVLAEADRIAQADLSAEVGAPDLVAATVVEVLEGDRIAVELGGVRTEVRYLGIEAPGRDRCYAAESTAINGELVVPGAIVWLERQRTNADPLGRLLRDVWVAGDGGARVLVAARLAELGAAVADPDPPNVRFAGWLAAAAAEAEAAGAGLWGACAEEAAARAPALVGGVSGPFFAAPWER